MGDDRDWQEGLADEERVVADECERYGEKIVWSGKAMASVYRRLAEARRDVEQLESYVWCERPTGMGDTGETWVTRATKLSSELDKLKGEREVFSQNHAAKSREITELREQLAEAWRELEQAKGIGGKPAFSANGLLGKFRTLEAKVERLALKFTREGGG